MLVAYVDESGTHDRHGRQPGSKIAGLAAYIASEREWTLFSKRWHKILVRYGAPRASGGSPYFHLSDFEKGEPPYGDWPEIKAERFIDELSDVIRRIRGHGFGAMVESRAYDGSYPKWLRAFDHGRFDHTYYFALQRLLEGILDTLPKRLPHRERLALVFDRQQQFKSVALKMCDAARLIRNDGFRFGTVTFADKADFPPLQAADILVHLMRRDVEEFVYTGEAGSRLNFVTPRRQYIQTMLAAEPELKRKASELEQMRKEGAFDFLLRSQWPKQ